MFAFFSIDFTFLSFIQDRISCKHFFSSSFRPNKSITISSAEYSRLLHNEIQLIKHKEQLEKCKGICQNKSSEIKRLQDQVTYYKRQAYKRTVDEQHNPNKPDLNNVIG